MRQYLSSIRSRFLGARRALILEKEPGVTFSELAQMFITRFERPSFKATSKEAAGIIRHVGVTKAGRWEVLDRNGSNDA